MALTLQAAKMAMIAFQRFGLGAKPGGPRLIGADPKGALINELQTPGIALIKDASLPTLAEAGSRCVIHDFAKGKLEAAAIRTQEITARIDKHMSVDIGFVERLVLFWSNHFTTSLGKRDIINATFGQVERDIIRPHVLGKFSDMLVAVLEHPAMIAYLDNTLSIGPHSEEALSGFPIGTGLNENLAREVMELHTMGARPVLGDLNKQIYSQADVTNFARALTGWSFVRWWDADQRVNGGSDANRGLFIYRPGWHEPGSFPIMGKVYSPSLRDGMKQARDAMLDFARHPATAQHLAFKLVRHFITDKPTAEMVTPLAQTFTSSGGDLMKVSLALLNLAAAWSPELTKIRQPYELAIAQFRAVGRRFQTETEYGQFSGALNALEQRIWDAPSPAGFPDDSDLWMTPEAMANRLDTALLGARIFGVAVTDVPGLAQSLYDKALSLDTGQRLMGSRPTRIYLTILFASPEFQRR